MTLTELVERLEELKTQIGGEHEVKMEVSASSVPVSDVGYEGSDEESLTIIIR